MWTTSDRMVWKIKAGGQENVALSLVAETPLCGMTGGSQSVNWGKVSRGNLPFPPSSPSARPWTKSFSKETKCRRVKPTFHY